MEEDPYDEDTAAQDEARSSPRDPKSARAEKKAISDLSAGWSH